MLSLSPQLKLQTGIQLSAALIQTLNLTQKAYPQFLDHIQHEINDNPFLEAIQEDRLFYPQVSATLPDKDIAHSGISLYETLCHQIDMLALTDVEKNILKTMAEHLDKDGYLREYAALKSKWAAQFHITERKLADYLTLLQSLEPEGVGARTLQECLLIQVRHHQFENPELVQLLKTVITSYLDLLEPDSYEVLAKELGITLDGVKALAQFIKENLTPRPAAAYDNTNKQILVPSLEAVLDKNTVTIKNLEQEQGLKLGLSSTYKQMLTHPDTDAKTRTFLKQQLQKAQETLLTVQSRYAQLSKIASILEAKQAAFFLQGAAFLIPFPQKELAAELHVSISTISRLVNQKYVQTPTGLVDLKTLFPRDFYGHTKQRLQRIIQTLHKENPGLTDEAFRLKLKKDFGISMARRTLNRYRSDLKKP